MTAKYYQNITKSDVSKIREICKRHGIKRCRKNASRTKPSVYVGVQCVRLPKDTSKAFLDDLVENGYKVDSVCYELADNGLFDSTNVYKY